MRCDPVREVQAIWATDTSVTLQWHGGNATQWEVKEPSGGRLR